MILDFRSRSDTRTEGQAEQSEPHEGHEAAVSAEIIIFPGVRRERHDGAAQTAAAQEVGPSATASSCRTDPDSCCIEAGSCPASGGRVQRTLMRA